MQVQAKVRRTSRPYNLPTAAKLRKAAQEIGDEAITQALELTSGGVSSRQLRRLGYPFSRRRPNPIVPKLPINRQSGALKRSFRIAIRNRGDVTQVWLRSNHPHAVVLNKRGTRTMQPRGFAEELEKRMKRKTRAIVRRVLRGK